METVSWQAPREKPGVRSCVSAASSRLCLFFLCVFHRGQVMCGLFQGVAWRNVSVVPKQSHIEVGLGNTRGVSAVPESLSQSRPC